MSEKRYRDGVWLFLYFPESDDLQMVFKGLKKGYWAYGTSADVAALETWTDYGREKVRTKDWESYYIDTDITKDWREAYTIASRHFKTADIFAEMREEELKGGEQ